MLVEMTRSNSTLGIKFSDTEEERRRDMKRRQTNRERFCSPGDSGIFTYHAPAYALVLSILRAKLGLWASLVA